MIDLSAAYLKAVEWRMLQLELETVGGIGTGRGVRAPHELVLIPHGIARPRVWGNEAQKCEIRYPGEDALPSELGLDRKLDKRPRREAR
jgi:hypothetical protein